MKNDTRNFLIWGIVGFAVIAGAYFLIKANTGTGKLDTFAQCLKDKGVVFYGAFWCSHCQSQKAMFGRSVKFLPYVECSTPDGKSQLPVCQEKKVEGYPTWVFSDGSQKSGEVSLEKLAEKTGCQLPQ